MEALAVGTQGHTSPEQFGKVMSLVKPRMAVGYHFYNDFDTQPEVSRRVRKTYDGPLTLSADLTVFNVTPNAIRVREAIVNPSTWPAPAPSEPGQPDHSKLTPRSEFINSGMLSDLVEQVVGTQVEDFKKRRGVQ